MASVDEEYIQIIEGLCFNEIKLSPIKCGFFVFPNNVEEGTLENVLLEGGEIVYNEIISHARDYLNKVPTPYTEKWNDAKYAKSLFGVTANILRPGSANQVSIQYDKWISDETIKQTSQQNLKLFIDEIITD